MDQTGIKIYGLCYFAQAVWLPPPPLFSSVKWGDGMPLAIVVGVNLVYFRSCMQVTNMPGPEVCSVKSFFFFLLHTCSTSKSLACHWCRFPSRGCSLLWDIRWTSRPYPYVRPQFPQHKHYSLRTCPSLRILGEER